MPQYSGGTRSGSAGSTTLPIASIYAGPAKVAKIREFAVFNTTAIAADIKLVRLLDRGTPGNALTEARHSDQTDSLATASLFDTHSVAPTLGDDLGYRYNLGTAVGSGPIWVFDKLEVGPGTNYGVGLIVATGVGQIVDWYIKWDEDEVADLPADVVGERDRRAVRIYDPEILPVLSSINENLQTLLALTAKAFDLPVHEAIDTARTLGNAYFETEETD